MRLGFVLAAFLVVTVLTQLGKADLIMARLSGALRETAGAQAHAALASPVPALSAAARTEARRDTAGPNPSAPDSEATSAAAMPSPPPALAAAAMAPLAAAPMPGLNEYEIRTRIVEAHQASGACDRRAGVVRRGPVPVCNIAQVDDRMIWEWRHSHPQGR